MVRDSCVGFVVETADRSVADPGSAFLTPGSGIRMGKKSNPDDISERLEAIFWVKILKLFEDADP